jgi:hypothetical protein
MWSDTLLRAEQLHLLRLLSWGALSVVAGTALLVFGLIRGRGSPLIRRFAVVCGTLGGMELAAGMIGYRALGPRDISSATRLEHLAWLELGLFLGLAAVGATVSLCARRLAAVHDPLSSLTLGAIGAGIATLLHGLSLALLELLLIAEISR